MAHRVSKFESGLLIAVTGGLLAQSAWSADSLAQRIEACAQHQEDAARLRCFDHEASVLRAEGAARASVPAAARGAAPAAPDASAAPAAKAAPAAEAAPGNAAPAPSRAVAARNAAEPSRSAAARESPATPQPATARVVSISTTQSDGALRFELDNGQVWQQNERETYLSLAAGDSVQIKAGSFRSFVLRTPSGVTTRVHQIR